MTDALTLAVIQAGLQQVCNEMDIAFSRAAFSPVIAEADDRSDGIYGAADGALIAQGELGLPVFVGTMAHSAAHLARLIREGAVAPPEPGDIYIVNDPYLGGTHLMDVRFARPFFVGREGEERLFCWLQNTGHWPDIGGMVPGGFSAHATEVEQEGLRLPPVKLFKRGALDREILAIIQSNIRVADQRIGDIKAQAAALLVGEARLRDLIARHGLATLEAAIAAIRDRAEERMRAEIRQMPDGVYRSEAFVDSDGVVNQPLRIAGGRSALQGARGAARAAAGSRHGRAPRPHRGRRLLPGPAGRACRRARPALRARCLRRRAAPPVGPCAMTLPVDELEAIWERLAQGVDQAGDRRDLFLAKLALLLADRLGDRAAIEHAIATALEDLR
ncbi:hydantoinase B/oxoprolinase family protein [Leptolyngbya sp. 15MV]|nr:hydantoinase B/oxoprolinase family protein [Leptolyngbya sp. 15MV]